MLIPSTSAKISLESLPVEILEGVLAYLQTKQLVGVGAVSRKLYASVDYLIRQRVRKIDSLDGHHLIFECSLPSGRFTTPYHHCHYNGTYSTIKSPGPSANPQAFSSIYTHFIPLSTSINPPRHNRNTPPQFPLSSITINLDTTEYFTQLCASSVLVKRTGTIASVINVFPETFFRIRRSWLRSAAAAAPWEGRMLWLDDAENVGLRLRATEREVRVQPPRVLAWGREDEGVDEGAASFVVEYEELVVRTGHLVDVVEKAWEELARELVSTG